MTDSIVNRMDTPTACDKLWNITKQLLISGHEPANKKDYQTELCTRIFALEPTNNSVEITRGLAVTHTAVDPTDKRAEGSAVTLQAAIEAL